jgi:DNA-binding GntR family transcriptional regulator
MINKLNKIDRHSFEPGYIQLVQILTEQMEKGVLRPGDKLPSESQLCKHNNISPMTVRRAINILIEKGLVIAEQGRGTFVKPLQLWTSAFDLGNLQKILINEDTTKIKILQASICRADNNIAAKLKINSGQRLIYIRRLIVLNNRPFLYHREYFIYNPQSPLIESEMEVTSLKGIFEGSSDCYVKRGSLTLEATVLTEDESKLLEAPISSPAFNLENIFYDFDDHPMSWGWFIVPGDRLKFTTKIGADGRSKSGND